VAATAFNALHRSLSRFYRVIVVGTGNNMRASNWDAAIAAVDQVVIVSTVREDTGQSAAWVADALNEKGYADEVAAAVTILAAPSALSDPALTGRLQDHFGRLTRGVVTVPFDPSLVSGRPIDIGALSSSSRDAWLEATALVADGM
jgi:MinD-like ATPase involved in chromosome partitioning or flagellar assembly